MKLLLLAWRNIRYRWLTQCLTALLILLSVALLWAVKEVRKQSEARFRRNLANIDLVVGATGSPLQLILSSVFHIDAPTGNIPYDEAQKIARIPMVKEVIPLAYGDYASEFRIVGTSYAYPEVYGLQLAAGKPWEKPGEACLGSDAARILGLKVGDHFHGSHGDPEAETGHGEYVVTGIYAPSGSVLDQLILCSIETVWNVHTEGHGENADAEASSHSEDHKNKEITALLIRYRNKMAALQLPRMLNARPGIQAASPAIEINRLSFMLNSGTRALNWVGYALLLLAALGILIQVWMGLEQRRGEFALLRYYGYGGWGIMRLLMLELGLVTAFSWIAGEILGRALLYGFSEELGYGTSYRLDILVWGTEDLLLLALPLALAVLCILLLASKVRRINIAELLKT